MVYLFFHFFEILIFWVVSGVKGQKMVQINKKFCLSCSIPQERCIIWLSFMVSMLEMFLSSADFFIFSSFDFLGFKGGKRVKMAQNYKKFYLYHSYLRKHITYDCNTLYTCVKWWHLQVLFSLIVGSTCFYMKSYLRSM